MAAVGIIGASGFTGAELLRLCAAHPDLDVVVATGDSQAGTAVADLYPSLAAHYGDLTFAEVDDTTADGCDVVFLGLPHGASQALVPDLASRVGHVIDLAADFRLRDAALYPEWYDEPHTAPGLLVDFAYGLPELYRRSIVGAPLIAVPGCYPTATSLALAPFVWGGHVEPSGLVVDAASGVSGAGRPRNPTPPSAPSTRTTPPTGWSATGTRRRWNRRSARGPTARSSTTSRSCSLRTLRP